MRFRLPHVVVGIAAAWVLAAPAAHAFTVENKDAAGQYAVPKFDLEEQSKNFRKDGAGATTNGNGLYETPLGNGTLQFGVQPGGSSNFGSVFGPGLGPSGSRSNLASGVRPPARAADLAGIQRRPLSARAQTAFAISRNLNF